MKPFLIIVSFFLCVAVNAQGRLEKGELTVDGLQRTFTVYVPSTVMLSQKSPVLFSLHGGYGTGQQMMKFADFKPIAEREKFLIVCPDGLKRAWNDGRVVSREYDDVKFISTLIDYIVSKYNGDGQRVYVTGMSNGGFMATRLACELNSKIAAIAAVGASMGIGASYQPDKAMPVMYIQGTKDPLVPYEGGSMGRKRGTIYSHAEILKLWVTADGCTATPVATNLPDNAGDGTAITREEYTNPATGVKVVGYTITGGGHTWPDGTQYLPKAFVGPVSHNLNACEVIWAFFKPYKLRN